MPAAGGNDREEDNGEIEGRKGEETSKKDGWLKTLKTLGKFIGPGGMVAVGYMDPGNWATGMYY